MRPVGLYLKNCPEWVVCEQACNAFGFVTVPLYDTLGHEAVEYILNQTGTGVVLCSPSEVSKLLGVKGQVASLAAVVQTGEVSDATRSEAEKAGVRVFSVAELEEIGRANLREVRPADASAVATICYTSGTTGAPKGAMLTHGNIVADVAGASVCGLDVCAEDVHLSYLPLAHMFERIVQAALWSVGAAVGFYQGDPRVIMDDLKALRPTVFPSVPRLYNRIYDKITQGAAAGGGIKAKLFHQAMESKMYWLRRGHNTHKLWDKLVFGKVKARVGLDRVRIMLTGSAPLASHVMDFLRVVFGARMQEGYGQTENAAAATLTFARDYTTGHVGGPLACNEIKLVSVPEMGYLVTDTVHGADEASGNPGMPCNGRGEVCLRGPNVFIGYYKNPEKTAEALDEDRWLHTGDIGLWTTNGAVKIIDRKKNIFKLAQGEYVAAEKIENVILGSPFVAQMFVYGDSLQSCLVGIAVPDEEYLARWAKDHGIAGSFADLCANETVHKAIMADIQRVSTDAKVGRRVVCVWGGGRGGGGVGG